MQHHITWDEIESCDLLGNNLQQDNKLFFCCMYLPKKCLDVALRKHFSSVVKHENIFLIFAQNIDCGYTLEPPRRGDIDCGYTLEPPRRGGSN